MSRLMIVEVPSYSCEFKGIREICDLVRCRECKYCEEYESTVGTEFVCSRTWCSPYDWANRPYFYVKPDDFCSYGERRVDE